MSRGGLCAALVGAALALASPAGAWLFTLPSTHPTSARALAIDQAGRIVAAGDLDFGTHRIFTVFHLDPETGNESSAYFHGFQTDGHARAVAIGTTDDDVFAAGDEIGDAADFLVTRSSADGLEAWATTLAGDAGCGDDVAHALAVDPQGQPIAAGQITNATPGGTTTAFAVVKLAESDGTVTWRTEIPDGVASAVTVDPAGDVLAAGVVGGAFAVVKLAGATGAVLWQTTLGAGAAVALVTGEAGTVYAAGQRGPSFAVAKLETAGGTELWPNGAGLLEGSGFARAITRLSDGDVVAAGELGTGAGRMFVTTRLDATDGSITWTDDDPSIPQPAAAYGLDHDGLDDVVSAGTAAHEFGPASFSVRALFGSDGSLAWGAGLLSDDAETRALVVRFDAVGDVLIAGQLALFGLAPSFTVEKLDGATGEDFQSLCGNDQLDPGEDCDDANTVDGDCCSSTCKFEAQGASCVDEGNSCTDDVCDGAGTCTHPAVADGTPCDDDDDCTLGDACASGQCTAQALADPGTPCNADFNPCTTDTCNAGGQCIAVDNADPCDDFNSCTSGDTCGNGFCQGTPVTGGSCDDFNPCTTGDTCDVGFCHGTAAPGTPCFSDFNPCTDDVCDVQGFCGHTPNTAACDDTNACTTGDHCEQGACVGTPGGGTTTSTSTTTTLATTTTSTSTTTTLATTTTTTSTSTTLATTTTTTTTSTTLVTTTSTTTTTVATSSSTTSTTVTTTTSTTVGSSTTTTLPSTAGAGCADGTREGLVPEALFPDIAACAGQWTGHVSNGTVLCAEGWSVCAPGADALQEVTYQDAIAVPGCFAYDAAQDNGSCQPCTGSITADDMAGMGAACTYKAVGSGSCIPGGRVDAICCGDYASGTACQFKPGLTSGVVCCRSTGSSTSTTSSSTTTTTTTTAPSSTSTSTTSSTTTTTLPASCASAADCDDGDPCNGVEGCVDGRCLAPRGIAGPACPAGAPIAVVTRFRADAVAFCNTRTRAVEATVSVGKSPWGVAWQPDGRRVLVTNRDAASVSVLDAVARSLVGTVRVGAQPLGVAVHPFLPRAYVASYDDDTVDVIDTGSLAVTARIRVGRGPSGVAVHPAGGHVYVSNYVDGSVSVIDAASNAVVGTVPTPALPVGVAVHPAGTKVYVACLKDRQLAVIGTVSDSVLDVVRVGRRPIGVAFDAEGARAYVTNSADATVTVLDAAADRVVDKVDVGSFPIGVAVAAGGSVWVADSRDGAMSVIPASGGTASVPIADTPVAIGAFIGTPPDGCPRGALACDDANPFTGDACRSGVGCAQATIPGPPGLRAGVAGIESILADPATADDPLAAEVRAALPALESAVAAAETGGDRTALRLVRRTLKPILRTLERAKRHGTLGSTGARLLDIAREARRQLKRLARHGA